MAKRARHRCKTSGCPGLTLTRYCDGCASKRTGSIVEPKYRTDAALRERAAFYGSARWKRVRLMKIRRDPFCERCWLDGRRVAAVDVHHRIDRLIRPELSFQLMNLESLCKPCHGLITRIHRQDGLGSSRNDRQDPAR